MLTGKGDELMIDKANIRMYRFSKQTSKKKKNTSEIHLTAKALWPYWTKYELGKKQPGMKVVACNNKHNR